MAGDWGVHCTTPEDECSAGDEEPYCIYDGSRWYRTPSSAVSRGLTNFLLSGLRLPLLQKLAYLSISGLCELCLPALESVSTGFIFISDVTKCTGEICPGGGG